MKLRDFFELSTENDYFTFQGKSYIRIGLTLYNVETAERLVLGLDF